MIVYHDHSSFPCSPKQPARREAVHAFRRAGFTLIEVMFAVITLGIGLTMLAAMFPVAIAQTRSNVDDGTAAAVARGAVAQLQGCFAGQDVPDTGSSVQPLSGTMRQQIYGNLICASDPRYAWIPLYRKNPGEHVAQVFVFVVRNRNRSTYTAGVDLPVNTEDTTGSGATLDPQAAGFTLTDGGAGVDQIAFNADAADTPDRVGPGSFVIVASPAGATAGRIYRLGELLDASTNTWALAPGWDMKDSSENLAGATGYIVGRGYVDPTDATKGYTGPTQDVAVYTAYVTTN